ncbi:hypothetical protein [Candidatus Endowatersipora endosymbiont of Watersipora subatra]|uniref:hypothetical protein n=1 Tax=Candidatus Endowatersipora endosymbiont of Watersipora subatra TaxID=3077946 RepID=UPI00312C7EA2
MGASLAKKLILLLVLNALTGCDILRIQSFHFMDKSDTMSIDGIWFPTDLETQGVYFAEFKDRRFVSRSGYDKKIMAVGNYVVRSPTQVELVFKGEISKSIVTAKCHLKTPLNLYCLPSVGSPFNLAKKS